MKQEVTSKKVFIRTLGWPMDVAKTDYGEDSGSDIKARIITSYGKIRGNCEMV